MVNMSQTEEKILKSLVEKPKTYYVLFKHEKVAKSNTTVLETLQKMDNKKWITEETIKDYGRNQKPYKLTLFGILVGYNQGVLTTKHIPRIVETFKEDIPLVFGEWNYFKEKGVLEIAEKHLVGTLKYCGKEYKRFLENLKEISKQERFYDLKKGIQEKWKQEKSWAEKITSTFLYYSFHYNPMVDSHRVYFSDFQGDEQKKLQKAIHDNGQLCLYCLMRAREEASFSTSQSRLFRVVYDGDRNLILDTSTVETKIHNIMWGKMRERAGKPDPFQKIANLALIEDWFSVAFELCNLYKNYTFNSEKEALQKIGSFSQFLAELRYGCVLNPLNSQESYDKLTKEQKDLLRKQEIGTTAALYFFSFRPVQVWDKTYYQLTPNIESMKKLKENRDVTIEAAKFLVRRDLKELESTEKER